MAIKTTFMGFVLGSAMNHSAVARKKQVQLCKIPPQRDPAAGPRRSPSWSAIAVYEVDVKRQSMTLTIVWNILIYFTYLDPQLEWSATESQTFKGDRFWRLRH
jgi:hypothetical protein